MTKIKNYINRKISTFGIDKKADIIAKNIKYNNFSSTFEVIGKNIKKSFVIKLNVPGKHNIYNALASISMALELNIKPSNIILSMKRNYYFTPDRFSNAKRKPLIPN